MSACILPWRTGAAMSAAFLLACAAHAAEPDFVPPAELLAAAKAEGKIVLYTANFLDTEQAVVKRFSARFPGIQIEIVRAPTGQLITRIRTEAAANPFPIPRHPTSRPSSPGFRHLAAGGSISSRTW